MLIGSILSFIFGLIITTLFVRDVKSTLSKKGQKGPVATVPAYSYVQEPQHVYVQATHPAPPPPPPPPRPVQVVVVKETPQYYHPQPPPPPPRPVVVKQPIIVKPIIQPVIVKPVIVKPIPVQPVYQVQPVHKKGGKKKHH